MLPQVLFVLVAHLSVVALAAKSSPAPTALTRARRKDTRSVPPEGFYDPRSGGGSWLTSVPNTFPAGLGEPINMILSGHSDEAVLVDSEDNGGFRNYMLSLGGSLGGLAGECLGQHEGSDQGANLGDGHGELNETAVLRWDYGDPQLGTCKETINGGDHIRYWTQNGPKANSGAIFMAASYEKPIAQQHDIFPDGYNMGRDLLVGNVTQQSSPIDTFTLTNGSQFSGSSGFKGFVYHTSVTYVAGYADNTSIGINHNGSVPVNGANAIDGLVAVFTVTITTTPANATIKKSAAGTACSSSRTPFAVAFVAMLAALL